MTVAKALGLQTDVWTVVSAAVASFGLAVYDHVPLDIPAEFIRLDGFTINNIDMKRGQVARHSFEVHHFLANVAGRTSSRGQTRSKTVLAAVHAAIMAATFQGARVNFEYMDTPAEPDPTTAHGVIRYTLTLV